MNFFKRAKKVKPAPEATGEHQHKWDIDYAMDPTSAGSVVPSGDLYCTVKGCFETVLDDGAHW